MRSDDAETRCGAIITDKYDTVIGTGFNGYVRGADSSLLPNIRPEKYPFMMHAEHNAILNCARSGVSTLDSIVYVSGMPCIDCYQIMLQAGVSAVYYTDYSRPKMSKEDEEAYDVILKANKNILLFIGYQHVKESFLRVERSLGSVYNIIAGT